VYKRQFQCCSIWSRNFLIESEKLNQKSLTSKRWVLHSRLARPNIDLSRNNAENAVIADSTENAERRTGSEFLSPPTSPAI